MLLNAGAEISPFCFRFCQPSVFVYLAGGEKSKGLSMLQANYVVQRVIRPRLKVKVCTVSSGLAMFKGILLPFQSSREFRVFFGSLLWSITLSSLSDTQIVVAGFTFVR